MAPPVRQQQHPLLRLVMSNNAAQRQLLIDGVEFPMLTKVALSADAVGRIEMTLTILCDPAYTTVDWLP